MRLVRRRSVYPMCAVPGIIPVRRVCLVVDSVTICQQKRFYRVLAQWDNCRFAGGWAIPVTLVRRFCADFNEASALLAQD